MQRKQNKRKAFLPTVKTRYTRCQYNNPRTAIDKYAYMCGSNFYESDVSMNE